ncbi:MAG TPA: rod shape-determining protein MreD [Alloiococcus sp.]|nr:rod shape-determining protein MreD [Alloiococcus sp.]
MEKWKTKIFPFFILVFFFLSDGFLANVIHDQLHFSIGYLTPRLTIICFVIFTIKLQKTNMFLLGLVIGFLFDSYYAGLLGPYMASFSLMYYMSIQLRHYFYPGWIAYTFIGTSMILFNELFVFSIYNVIGLTGYTFSQFWAQYIGITFAGNFVLLLLLIPLFDQLATYLSE